MSDVEPAEAPRERRRSGEAARLPWGSAAVAAALLALAVVVAWQALEGLAHIDRMLGERSRTLYRMAATEVRNVARFGAGRLERLDEVLEEVAGSGDVAGVELRALDGPVRIVHGEFPSPMPEYRADGESYVLDGGFLLLAGEVHIETQGCGSCPSCAAEGHGCGAASSEMEGDYEVLLALDAEPYLALRRTVWLQAGVGALTLAALALGLGLYATQMRRAARMREALAVSDERARSLERLGRMAAGLAHEIKNPVGSLRGFAQLLGERADPASKEAEYAGIMVTELDAITRRIDRLRDWARPSPPVFRPERPAAIVRRVAGLLAPDLEARALGLELELPEGDGPSTALDAERFRDLVLNLLMNAIEASPRDGKVVVRLVPPGRDGGWRFEVDDQGPGVPPEERQRVLRPFHSTKPGGMGLGLAVAQQAIEDHGGRLEIDGAPGGGARVRAVWPEGAGRG